jgi:hypothetical protein
MQDSPETLPTAAHIRLLARLLSNCRAIALLALTVLSLVPSPAWTRGFSIDPYAAFGYAFDSRDRNSEVGYPLMSLDFGGPCLSAGARARVSNGRWLAGVQADLLNLTQGFGNNSLLAYSFAASGGRSLENTVFEAGVRLVNTFRVESLNPYEYMATRAGNAFAQVQTRVKGISLLGSFMLGVRNTSSAFDSYSLEGQAGLVGAYRLSWFSPYAGIGLTVRRGVFGVLQGNIFGIAGQALLCVGVSITPRRWVSDFPARFATPTGRFNLP